MPQSKRRKAKGRGEIVPPLSKLARIEELLKIQLETFPQKELTPAEIARWEQDLSAYPLEAIEYAFECHRQLAMFFPVPVQILDICKTWIPRGQLEAGCSHDCRRTHHKGYGEIDILILWKEHDKKFRELKRPLDESEFEALLDSLDEVRGRSPEWRATLAF